MGINRASLPTPQSVQAKMTLTYNILVLGVFLSLAVRSSWGISGIVETADIKIGLFGKFCFVLLPVMQQRGHSLLHVVEEEGMGKTILFSHGFWDIWLPWYISARCSSYFTDFSHFSKLNNSSKLSNLRKLSKLSNFKKLTF